MSSDLDSKTDVSGVGPFDGDDSAGDVTLDDDDSIVVRRSSLNSKYLDDDGTTDSLKDSYRSVSCYIEQDTDANVSDIELPQDITDSSTASLNNVFPSRSMNSKDPPVIPAWTVCIDNPEKILTAMDTFISFRVTAETSRSDIPEPHIFQTTRRYSDFVFLRNCLTHEYPMKFIPPLPEKHSVYSIDRFDYDFIRQRCILLDIFMRRVINERCLAKHPAVHQFLFQQATDWNRYQKSISLRRSSYESWSNYASSILNGIASHPEYFKQSKYCEMLEEQLSSVEKLNNRVHKHDIEYMQDLASLRLVYAHWANNEESSALKSVVLPLTDAMDNWSSAQETWTSRYDGDMFAPLREMILFSKSVRQVLERRDFMQVEVASAKDNLAKKKAEKDELSGSTGVGRKGSWFGTDPEQAREAKVLKLTEQIEEQSRNASRLTDQLTQANVEIEAEINQWNGLKDKSLKKVLTTLAKQRIEFHKQCLDGWTKAISEIVTTTTSTIPPTESDLTNDQQPAIVDHQPVTMTSDNGGPLFS